MFLLQYGAEPVPKSISVKGGGDSLLWEPIIGVAVESDQGWLLLESGIGRRALEDADALAVLYPTDAKPWGLDGDPLVAALAAVGLHVSDIALAAVSHLHVDHSGGLRLLADNGVPIAVHQDELAYASRAGRLEDGYYPPDYQSVNGGWRELEGDAELAPGVWALATPGHAPGHMSYRVDLAESGTWLFAVDAADLGQNLVDGSPPGQTVDPADGPRARASLRRLVDEADRLRARLVPGHDQFFWDAVRHPTGGHR
jgi:glyoxylase-like metal-dependent hydrolase (beta-lactamase superfamily II)